MWSNEDSKVVSRLYTVTILGSSVVIAAMLAARVVLNFRNLYYMSHVQGAWLTCAYDFVHGVLYRPLFGPIGYGGTRFFPLYFVLTGSLSRIFGRLEDAGLILSAVSVVLLACGCFVLLRRLDVSLLLSLAAAAAVISAATTHEALLTTKGDGLAAMLNIWGIALCLSPNDKEKRIWLYPAAVLFSLAFAAKLTTVFGFASVVIVWTLSRRFEDLARLGVATCLGYVAVVSAIYFGSGGRALEIFRVCASGGGSIGYAIEAPLQMIGTAIEYDPLMVVFLVPATAFAFSYFKKIPTEILPIYFFVVLAATTVIFASRGTLSNHLLDLHVAGVLVVAYSASRNSAFAEIGTGILAAGLVVASLQIATDLHYDLSKPSRRTQMRQLVEKIPADGRPILAENAFVVVQSGKTPYLLDPFMFRVFTARYPALGVELRDKLAHQGFSAVVLERDPDSEVGRNWYKDVHFGGSFVQDLEANYSLSYSVGPESVYLPKATQP
jgi:hypothetical protein